MLKNVKQALLMSERKKTHVHFSIYDHIKITCSSHDSLSITSIWSSMLEVTFFQNTREFLKILCVRHVERVREERNISFITWISNYLCNSILTDLLGELVVDAIHGHRILILKIVIYNAYMSIHSHRIMASSLLIDS